VPEQKHDSRISGESSGRPKLFADTDYTAKLFNETSGRLDIRSVAEIYDLSISELARMINVEAKTAHKTPDSAAIHEGLIPFEEVARTLSLMRGSVSDFRRWLNASNAELNYRAPLQMIRAGQIHELAGIVRSAPFRSARLRCWLKLAGKFWRVVATSSLLGLVRGENALPEVTRVHPNLLFAGGPRRVGGRYTPMD
jgi:hypothetical protein